MVIKLGGEILPDVIKKALPVDIETVSHLLVLPIVYILFSCRMASGSGRVFTGMVNMTILEAKNLKTVTLPGGFQLSSKDMDPYCVVDFDDFYFGRTTHKNKTSCPVWNESFEEPVEDAARLQVTVFHQSTIPPDPFIAHLQVEVVDLINSNDDEFIVCH